MSEIIKKKKKRSFIQKAKKFGRQRNNRKEKQLSEEEYNFYITIYQHLKHPEFEEKDLILKNFFRSIEDDNKLKSLVTDQTVSRIFNEVLPVASPDKVIFIMQNLSQDLRIFCTDPFASHVLQTLLILGLKYIQKDAFIDIKSENSSESSKQSIKEEERINFIEFLLKTSKFIYNNLQEFICDTYASHVIRTVLEVCSGVEVDIAVKSSQKAQTNHSIQQDSTQIFNVPPQLSQIVIDLSLRISQLPNFVDVICDDSGSATVQTALLVLNSQGDKTNCKLLLRHIIKHGFKALSDDSKSEIHSVFEENSTSRLLEVVLSVSNSKGQQKIFRLLFEGKILELVRHRIGNFAVQKLLCTWKQKESFVMIYDSVSTCLNEAIQAGNIGVAFALVKACRRLATHQSRCLKDMSEFLQCSQPTDIQKMVPCLLYFLPLSSYEQAKEASEELKISLHGSLIIQEFLLFNKPIKIVLSILEMNLTDLQKIACDPRGSHIVDTFVDSPSVGEKNREKFINIYKGSLANLACSKHGSRSIEALWRVASIKSKTLICNELLENSKKILGNTFGKYVFSKFQVNLFKRNDKSDWEELQLKKQKKRQLLHELLEDTDAVVNLKKKTKKEPLTEVIN